MIFANYLRRAPRPVTPARMLKHAGNTSECGTFFPEDGGPVVLVIGSQAPKEAIRRLARFHTLEASALLAFAGRT